MDLSIVIVSWNVKELLKENLKAIYDNTQNVDFEVFVVDNDSHDNTAEMIKKDFQQVRLIENNFNAGFAKANNQAIKKSQGKLVLLLNPDMQVLPGTLEKMVEWMKQDKKAGVVGCRLIDENKKTVPHVRRFPTFFDQLMIILKVPHLFPFVLNKYLMKDFDYDKETEVDSIRGAFFMIKREVIEKVGEMDEQYFLWFEEVDYCKQVKKAGFKIMYNPEVRCINHTGKSFSQVKRTTTQKYFRDSMLKYFKKWHPAWQYYILKITWPIGILISKIKK
ncbi:glycosyltransferase family 2 protein [Candidatus Falkowbacteria bacterium]|jgi:GT2 family glycosyltransferase|nr:glycosyltransferase family 2 protein [Candidatus Falkowbacteria bacterium]MBT4433241.1 glycosyltransferase family 2 protein [Candidatus Falkowbacteria bacterium]